MHLRSVTTFYTYPEHTPYSEWPKVAGAMIKAVDYILCEMLSGGCINR